MQESSDAERAGSCSRAIPPLMSNTGTSSCLFTLKPGLILAAAAKPHIGTGHPPPPLLWATTKEEEETRALLGVSEKLLFPRSHLSTSAHDELRGAHPLPSPALCHCRGSYAPACHERESVYKETVQHCIAPSLRAFHMQSLLFLWDCFSLSVGSTVGISLLLCAFTVVMSCYSARSPAPVCQVTRGENPHALSKVTISEGKADL